MFFSIRFTLQGSLEIVQIWYIPMNQTSMRW
jgi:hypothetical protein